MVCKETVKSEKVIILSSTHHIVSVFGMLRADVCHLKEKVLYVSPQYHDNCILAKARITTLTCTHVHLQNTSSN